MKSRRDSSTFVIVGIQPELEVHHSNSTKLILNLTSPKSRCNHFRSQLHIVYNYDYYTPTAILCSSWKVSLYTSANPWKDTHEWLLQIGTILLHVILTYDFYVIIRRVENQSGLIHKLKMGNYLKSNQNYPYHCNRGRTAVRRSSHASPFSARRISNEVNDYSTELETALKAALLYKKVKSARHTCRHQREDQT